jgi:deoxyxylulose-5-phosphate synthase
LPQRVVISAPGLGLKVLDITFQYVVDTPGDRLVWDVSHATFRYGILTGWRDCIAVLLQYGQPGSAKRTENEYSPFGAADTSTPISAGLAAPRDFSRHAHLPPSGVSRFRGLKRLAAGWSARVPE